MWMEKEHFADWMLTDQKAFAGYARLFMGCSPFWVGGHNIWGNKLEIWPPWPPGLGERVFHLAL